MKIYSHYGINDFVICLGYKGYMIKEYFANYFLHMSDVTFDMSSNQMHVHHKSAEPWKVTPGGHRRELDDRRSSAPVREYLDDDAFLLHLWRWRGRHGYRQAGEVPSHPRQAGHTVTAIQPPGRYGALAMDEDMVLGFQEKPKGDGGWINGGFCAVAQGA